MGACAKEDFFLIYNQKMRKKIVLQVDLNQVKKKSLSYNKK